MEHYVLGMEWYDCVLELSTNVIIAHDLPKVEPIIIVMEVGDS